MGELVPLLPAGDPVRVLLADHLQRAGSEEDPERRLVGVHELENRRLRLGPWDPGGIGCEQN